MDRILDRIVTFSIFAALSAAAVSKAAAEIAAAAALSSWLVLKFRQKNFPAVRTVWFFSYAAFLACAVISLRQVPPDVFMTGLRGLVKWLKFTGLFFVCLDVFTEPGRRDTALRCFVIAMVIVAADGFYQLYTGADLFFRSPLDPGRIVRMKSCLGAPNTLAAFLYFGICSAVSLAGREKRRGFRISYLSAAAISVLALVLTFSRAGAAAFGLSVFCHVFILYPAARRRLLQVSAAVLALLIYSPPLRFNFIQSLGLHDISLVERLSFWKQGFAMLRDHPVFGIGVNMYYHKLVLYFPDAEKYAYAHNSWLQIASETGIAGVVFFAAPLVWSFWKLLSRRVVVEPAGAGLAIPVLAFCLQSLVDNHFFALKTAYLFWIFWGMLGSQLYETMKKPGAGSESGLREKREK